MEQLRFTTDGQREERRATLLRDVAYEHFKLGVSPDETAAEKVWADIQLCSTPQASLVEVRSSRGVVERTSAHARAEHGDRLLVYLLEQGQTRFCNGLGQEFATDVGSLLIGGDDATFRALPAPAQSWNFKAFSIPSRFLPHSGTAIRRGGLQAPHPAMALSSLLTQYLRGWHKQFAGLSETGMAASVRALDELLAALVEPGRAMGESGQQALAQLRRSAALDFIRSNFGRADLRPETVAAYLQLSPRQLHRAFEASGTSVGTEIRRARLLQAQRLLVERTLSITEIAYTSGFESLATFYRAFKSEFGMTAAEMRASAVR